MKEVVGGVLYHTTQVAQCIITYMIYKKVIIQIATLISEPCM